MFPNRNKSCGSYTWRFFFKFDLAIVKKSFYICEELKKQIKIKNKIIKFSGYVMERVKKDDISINIPEESYFFQRFNHKEIIGIFPQFATWEGGDGSVWELQIVQVSENNILKTALRTHPERLSHEFSRMHLEGRSKEDILKCVVIDHLKNFFRDDCVSFQTFINKVEQLNNSIQKLFIK